MGDRYTWNEDCPNCKGKDTVEFYDAPSSLLFVAICKNCDWKDPRSYYEIRDTIELLTKEQHYQKIMDDFVKLYGEEWLRELGRLIAEAERKEWKNIKSKSTMGQEG